MTRVARRVAASLGALACAAGVVVAAGQSPPTIPRDTLITLWREGSDGSQYSVSIDALGRVEYEGEHVRVEGRQTDHIPQAAVVELLDFAARIGFFTLRDEYLSVEPLPPGTTVSFSDVPSSEVSVRVNGRSKRIRSVVGAPQPLTAFEARIDAVTRSKRWTFLDEPMLASLRAGGWTPSNEELAELLRHAVQTDDLPIVRGLLDFGADPNRGPEGWGPPILSVQSVAALRALLAAGGDLYARIDEHSLLSFVSGLEPEATALLLQRGLRADDDALFSAVYRGNAEVVTMLLAAGANPAARGSNGQSVLEFARQVRQWPTGTRSPDLPYRQNPSEVVALLERALAKR